MSDSEGREGEDHGRASDLYRRIVEKSNDVVVVVDADGTVTYANSAVERLLCYSPREFTGNLGREYIHPEDGDAFVEAFESVQSARNDFRTIDVRFRRADGTYRWLETTMRNCLDDDVVDGVLLKGRDITERREREAELRTTKERMKMALEGANLGIWDWNMVTDEVERDELLSEMLGYTSSEMGNHLRDWERVVHPEGERRHNEALAHHIANRTPYYECEYRLKTKSGEWKWVRTMGKVVERDEDGSPIRAVGIHQDVDDQKRARMALEEERDMFKEGPAVVFKWDDSDGWPVEYASQNVEDVLGYTAAELESDEVPFADIVHDDDLERLSRAVAEQRHEESDRFNPEPYRVWTADGDVRWVMEYTRNIAEDGEADYLLGYLVDITERKRRERELRQYKKAVDESAHAIYITDAEGTIEYVNPAFERVTGYSEEAALGRTPRLLQSGVYGDEFYEDLWETVRSGEQWEAEIIDERADGETVVLNQTVAPITDDGDIWKFVAVARDITERKEREREIRDREEKYRSLFEDTRDALMVFDRNGYLDCNERALELFGIDSVDSFREYTPWELSPSQQPDGTDSKTAALRHIETAFEEGEDFFEWTHQRVDGTDFPSEVKLSRFEYEGSPVLHALIRDITERKKQERELQAREQKYRNLFADTRDALMLLDRDGFFDCNERTLELFGVDSVDAFVEYAPWELSPPTQPDGTDSKEAALDHVETSFDEGEALFEWTHERVDGTEFLAEVKLSRFEHEGEAALHALVRDITERKEYERRIEEQRDNLNVLNQVLRHDVRNDIQLIVAYADLIADECDESEVEEYAELVLENANHAVELTRSAREMAEVMLSAEEELQRVDAGDVLERECEELRSARPEAVITNQKPIPSVAVQANDMLGSVFRNLLKNAVQHNDETVPEVTVSVSDGDDSVVIRVADNGRGIPDQQKDAIFGKGEKDLDSQGTGLGLYLVETLVESYGGDVWVTDNEPEGSVFAVELPKVG